MKASDLRDLTLDELRQKESDLSAELFNLRFQLATNQLENPMRLPLTRKDLARVKTVIAQKERAVERTE
jgi:large subunit ribosomal protein L29